MVNCAALWVLVHGARWHYLAAAPAAMQLSVVHNFLWHDRWTFTDRRGDEHWLARFGHYELSTLAGLAVNWIVLAALVGWMRWPLLPANLLGILAGTVLNFTVSKLWTWKRQPSTVMA